MALGEFKLFQFKSKKQREKEEHQYAQWAFPYGQLQRENLTNLVKELVPKASIPICLASFLTCKELYERVLEDSESSEIATEKMLTTIRNYGQLIRSKEMPLYLALVLADANIDESCLYPPAEELRKNISELEEIRKSPKPKKKRTQKADSTEEQDKENQISNQSIYADKPNFDGEVLVCDDNPINQELIREHMKRVGLRTVTADNGKIGFDLIKDRLDKGDKMFDLVFMDIYMPVMDGIEAANKIKSLDNEIPIIALTANTMTSDLEKYKRNGMPDCLGKPFTTTDLWNTLLKYIKPVSTGIINESKTEDEELQAKLKLSFIQNNRGKFTELVESIEKGDLKLARRIVHTLKGNAGQLKRINLQKAAESVEKLLIEDSVLPKDKLDNLQSEFDSFITELEPMLNNIRTQETIDPLSKKQTKELFDKLEVLLKDGNTGCLLLLDDVRNVPGADELVKNMETYDFNSAEQTLKELINQMKQETSYE